MRLIIPFLPDTHGKTEEQQKHTSGSSSLVILVYARHAQPKENGRYEMEVSLVIILVTQPKENDRYEVEVFIVIVLVTWLT